MNLLKFLKSSSGKVTVPGMLVMGAVGATLVWSAMDTAKVAINPMQDRDVIFSQTADERASIYNSGITGTDGTVSFSNTYNGGITVGDPAHASDDTSLADTFSSAVGSAIGSAYTMQNGVGGMADNPNFIDTTPAALTPDTSSPVSSTNVRGAASNEAGSTGSAGGAGGTSKLGSANMATAQGGGSFAQGGNGGSAGTGSSSAGGSGARGGNGGGNGSAEGYQLSGNMPTQGDGLLAGVPTNSKANFGGANGARVGGRLAGGANGGEELRRIADYAKRVAGHDLRSANETAGAFLGEDGVYVSGGLTEGENTDPNNPDFAPMKVNGGKRNGPSMNTVNAHLLALAKAKKSLAIQLLVMVGVCAAMALTMYLLIKHGKKMPMGTGAGFILAGLALMGVAMGYALAYIAVCGRFAHKWGSEAGSLPVSGIFLSVAVAMAVKGLAASALSDVPFAKTNSSFVNGLMKFGKFGSFLGPIAPTIGLSKIGEVFSTAMTDPKKVAKGK